MVVSGTVSVAANASDATGISKVEFYNGTTLLATILTAPYNFNWLSVPTGTYTLTAKAYDSAGNISNSSSVAVALGFNTTIALPTSGS